MNVKYFKIRKRYIPTVWPVYNYWVDMERVTGEKSSIIHLWEKGGLYTGFVDTEGLKKRGIWSYNYIIKNYDIMSLDLLRERGVSYGEKLILECKNFSLQPEEHFTIKNISDFYKRADRSYIDYYENNMLFWISADQIVINKIDQLLSNYSDLDKKEIWEVMRLPTKPSFSSTEEKEFEELKEIAKKDGVDSVKFKENTKLFSDKYIWFPFEYGGPEIYDVKTVTKRVEEELRDYKTSTSPEEDIKSLQESVINKHFLSDQIIFHFLILQTLSLMQDDRKAVNAHACYYVNNIVLKKLSKIFDLPIEDLFLIDPILLDECVKSGNLDDFKKCIQKRNEMLVIYLSENDEFVIKEGKKECIDYLESLGISLDGELENKEIKGKVAHPGKVSGVARVVKKSSECESLNEGEILVTYMTTPDFVPYMKKASAIVTEEGGITCHAAIVARELNKPCVIGTKNVMSAIKNGDRIEVDANNGIVKILKINVEE